jgi:hypothetical protein
LKTFGGGGVGGMTSGSINQVFINSRARCGHATTDLALARSAQGPARAWPDGVSCSPFAYGQEDAVTPDWADESEA